MNSSPAHREAVPNPFVIPREDDAITVAQALVQDRTRARVTRAEAWVSAGASVTIVRITAEGRVAHLMYVVASPAVDEIEDLARILAASPDGADEGATLWLVVPDDAVPRARAALVHAGIPPRVGGYVLEGGGAVRFGWW
ncbi:MAG: hypothetical protein ACOZNI_19770 [Myxococcota bacterium]